MPGGPPAFAGQLRELLKMASGRADSQQVEAVGCRLSPTGLVAKATVAVSLACQVCPTRRSFPGWYVAITDRRPAVDVTACPPSDTITAAHQPAAGNVVMSLAGQARLRY